MKLYIMYMNRFLYNKDNGFSIILQSKDVEEIIQEVMQILKSIFKRAAVDARVYIDIEANSVLVELSDILWLPVKWYYNKKIVLFKEHNSLFDDICNISSIKKSRVVIKVTGELLGEPTWGNTPYYLITSNDAKELEFLPGHLDRKDQIQKVLPKGMELYVVGNKHKCMLVGFHISYKGKKMMEDNFYNLQRAIMEYSAAWKSLKDDSTDLDNLFLEHKHMNPKYFKAELDNEFVIITIQNRKFKVYRTDYLRADLVANVANKHLHIGKRNTLYCANNKRNCHIPIYEVM